MTWSVACLLAWAVVTTGCSTNPRPRVLPPKGPAIEAPSDSAVVRTATRYLGTPYVLGGISPATGFDCSGFVWYVFKQLGVDVPRGVVNQASAGRHVERPDIRAGDLVFFSTTGPGFTHVGIAVSPTSFIHAPNSRGVVRIEPLTSSYWAQRFAGARRIGN